MEAGRQFLDLLGKKRPGGRQNLHFVQKKLAPFSNIVVNLQIVHLPIPYFRPQAFTEPPAMVRVLPREDVQWNRKLFKAPPLNVPPPVAGPAPFAANLRSPVSPAKR